MSVPDRLGEIQARADAASGDSWRATGRGHQCYVVADTPTERGRLVVETSSSEQGHADAEFIAHARADVPRLVTALRAVLDLHVGVVDCCDECSPMKCAVCEAWEWPCDTVHAVVAALEGEES